MLISFLSSLSFLSLFLLIQYSFLSLFSTVRCSAELRGEGGDLSRK
jgi:hypothetical protein